MTREEVKQIVIDALVKQDHPSKNKDGFCAYRGAGGSKCAVGHLIPDNMYSSTLEDKGVRHEDVQFALPPEFRPHTKLLADLQRLHDNSPMIPGWGKLFATEAAKL